MVNAASAQAIEEGKKRLREFLEENQGGGERIQMRNLNGGKGVGAVEEEEGDEI